MSPKHQSTGKWIRRTGALAFICLLALVSTQPGQAAPGVINRKISGTMVDLGDVMTFKISEEGDYIAFAADRFEDGKTEIFVVPLYGKAEPLRLNGTLVYGGKVVYSNHGFQISHDTRRVVYLADQQTLGKYELYSVPLTGGESLKLNDDLDFNEDVWDFKVSADGHWVVYRADKDLDEVFELYSVPIDRSSEPVRLNGDLQPDSDVEEDYEINSTSDRVVYRAQQDTAGVFELYSVPIGGGTSLRLNKGAALEGHSTTTFKITPNGAGVIFTTVTTPGIKDLYSNYISGITGICGALAPFKISNIPPEGGTIVRYAATPNSLGVLYTATQESATRPELFSNSICGGTVNMHKLSGTMPPNFDNVGVFFITKNSGGVVYDIADNDEGVMDLYSNYTTGGDPVHLIPSVPPGGGGGFYQLSNNDTRVVYVADQEVLEEHELYSIPITGPGAPGEPRKLTGNLPTDVDVAELEVTPDGLNVVYRVYQSSTAMFDLYTSNTMTGPALKLNGTLAENGAVQDDFKISPDSKVAVYRADQDVDEKFELYISFLGYGVYLPNVIR